MPPLHTLKRYRVGVGDASVGFARYWMGEKLIVREGFRLTPSEKRILFFHPIIRERKIVVFTFILVSQNTSEPLEMAAIHKWLMQCFC